MSTPAGDGLVGDATIRVDGDTDPAMRALGRFARSAQDAIRTVRDRFTSGSAAINRAITSNTPTLDVNTAPATRAVAQFSSNAQGQLRDAQGRFVRAGDNAGQGVGGGLLSGLGGTIRSGIGSVFSSAISGLSSAASAVSSSPVVSAIGTAIAVGVVASTLPLIGALLSGAVISVAGLGIIGLGAALLKNEPEIKAAAGKLSETLRTTLTDAAQRLKKPFETALGDLRQTVLDLAPQIDQAFKTVAESGAVQSLTDGIDKLAKNAMPGFLKLLEDTGPTFEGIESLLSEVGEGLGGFFEGIAGSGPDAKLALQDLGTAIKGLLIAAGETIGFLARVYSEVRKFVGLIVEGFQWLYDRIVGNSLIPDLIIGIRDWFMRLPEWVLTQLQRFRDFVVQKFTEVVTWVKGVPGRISSALVSLGSMLLMSAVSAGQQFLSGIRSRISAAVTFIRGLPGRAFRALANLGVFLRARAVAAGALLVSAIRQRLSAAVTLIGGLPGRAFRALRALAGGLGRIAVTAFNRFRAAVSSGISRAVGIARTVPGRIRSAISSLGGLIARVASNAFSRFRSIISSGAARAVGIARTVPGRIRSAISSLGSLIASVARSALSRFVGAIRSGASRAVGVVRGIPGRIRGALSGLGGLLRGAGQAIIQGLINGIRSLAGRVTGAVRSVMSAARNLLPGSPAKEGPFSGKGWSLFSGRAISDALAQGIGERERAVQRAARMVAESAQSAVSMPLQVTPTGAASLGTDLTAQVGAIRAAPVSQATRSVVIHLTVVNEGVISSQLEAQNFLARALSDLGRTGRLPTALRTA